ncbi:MAG: hypothetical protein QW318_08325 [Candidatus Caldarchaeum sp.]|uniref:Uncharacterized protein n=1 Tax=Caldiarchaeum subterraneum TaxID=311458 RepID=A0A7J3G6Y2_CALS0
MGAYPHGRESRQDDVVVVSAPGKPNHRHNKKKQKRSRQMKPLVDSPSTATWSWRRLSLTSRFYDVLDVGLRPR